MNLLQKLINGELVSGKSYRELEKRTGVNHVSLSDYHKDGVVPSGKNLAKLGEYFKVEYFKLVEPAQAADNPATEDERLKVAYQMFVKAFNAEDEEGKNLLTSELFGILSKKRNT